MTVKEPTCLTAEGVRVVFVKAEEKKKIFSEISTNNCMIRAR